jgi:hypothetical protein
MTSRSIARLVLLMYWVIPAIVLPSLILVLIKLITQTEPIGDFLTRASKDFVDNSFLLLAQTAIMLITIWILGGLIPILIHKNRINSFFVGSTCLLILWLILFLTSALTSSGISAVEMGDFYFKITFQRWVNYDLVPFIIIGAIHGLTTGFFLGREIKKKTDVAGKP